MGIKVKVLHQDVPTRWGSTRAATESFLDEKSENDSSDLVDGAPTFKNADAINEALKTMTFKKKQKRHELILTRSDMIRIKNINKLLKKIDVFSTTLGSKLHQRNEEEYLGRFQGQMY